jgi:hypothetical protein
MTAIREFELTPEMKELGFSRIYRKDRNLVIYNSGELVHAKYFPGDLNSTLHHLEKALTEFDKRTNNHFGNEKIERFIRLFAELDIKTDEAEEDVANQIKIQENIERGAHYRTDKGTEGSERWNIFS